MLWLCTHGPGRASLRVAEQAGAQFCPLPPSRSAASPPGPAMLSVLDTNLLSATTARCSNDKTGFHKAYLDASVAMFGRCTQQTVAKLEAATAAAGGGAAQLDMETEFLNLGLDIIGLGVFNYDFGSITRESPVIKARSSSAAALPPRTPTPRRGSCRLSLPLALGAGSQRGRRPSHPTARGLSLLLPTLTAAAFVRPRAGCVRRAEGGRAPLHLLHPLLEPAAGQAPRWVRRGAVRFFVVRPLFSGEQGGGETARSEAGLRPRSRARM